MPQGTSPRGSREQEGVTIHAVTSIRRTTKYFVLLIPDDTSIAFDRRTSARVFTCVRTYTVDRISAFTGIRYRPITRDARNSVVRERGYRESVSDAIETIKGGTVSGEVSWSTTETPFTAEEEDAIVTLVVVVVGIIVAIVILFSMGIFIDCKHQYANTVAHDFLCCRLIGYRRTDGSFFSRKKDALKKRKLKLRMPPISRARKSEKEDVKSLASDMCPNGASDGDFRTRSAVV